MPGLSVVGNTVWLSGESGSIFKSTDRGLTWTQLASGTDVMIDAISFADPDHGWASSVQRKLLHSSDGGSTWTEQKIDAFLPGCPPSADLIWEALTALVEGRPLKLTYDLIKFD